MPCFHYMERALVCTAPPAISRLTEVNVTQPEVTWVKLSLLPNETRFNFYVWATTSVGRGDVAFISESTLPIDCKHVKRIDFSDVSSTRYSVLVLGVSFNLLA